LLEQSPARFDVGEVLFALLFSAAFFHQAVSAPDAFHGGVADGEIELAFQAARSEGGKYCAELDELSFDGGRGLVRLVEAGTGVLDQPGRTVLLETAEPLADRGHGGGEEPGGGFDALLLGALDQSKAMVVRVFHVTHQIEITSGGSHGARILRAPRRPAPPPSAGRPVLPTASG
jgi:hypothetical protein